MDLFGLVCQHIIEYPFKKMKTLEYIGKMNRMKKSITFHFTDEIKPRPMSHMIAVYLWNNLKTYIPLSFEVCYTQIRIEK